MTTVTVETVPTACTVSPMEDDWLEAAYEDRFTVDDDDYETVDDTLEDDEDDPDYTSGLDYIEDEDYWEGYP